MIAQRRVAESVAKLGGIRAELDGWSALSEPKGPLRLHHSQIRAIVRSLAPTIEGIAAGVDGGDDWMRTERDLLRLHDVWHFFREKLLQRMGPTIGAYLAFADDVAWECYRPAQQAATPAGTPETGLREPPLTFLGTYPSPYALPRGAPYARVVWANGTPPELIRAAAEKMPVPVVGLPWFQVRHLPDALLVGHEVGHHLETDFELTDALTDNVLAAVPQQRSTTWGGWMGEAFADVYGALCGGEAYGLALADFAAAGDAALTGDSEYPPLGVRLALVAATLDLQGLPNRDLAAAGAGEPATADVPDVVAALADTPLTAFGGRRLREVQSFGGLAGLSGYAASALLSRGVVGPGQARVLLAAATLAFHANPGQYADLDVTSAVLREAEARRDAGIRASSTQADPAGRDAAAGTAVERLLRGTS